MMFPVFKIRMSTKAQNRSHKTPQSYNNLTTTENLKHGRPSSAVAIFKKLDPR